MGKMSFYGRLYSKRGTMAATHPEYNFAASNTYLVKEGAKLFIASAWTQWPSQTPDILKLVSNARIVCKRLRIHSGKQKKAAAYRRVNLKGKMLLIRVDESPHASMNVRDWCREVDKVLCDIELADGHLDPTDSAALLDEWEASNFIGRKDAIDGAENQISEDCPAFAEYLVALHGENNYEGADARLPRHFRGLDLPYGPGGLEKDIEYSRAAVIRNLIIEHLPGWQDMQPIHLFEIACMGLSPVMPTKSHSGLEVDKALNYIIGDLYGETLQKAIPWQWEWPFHFGELADLIERDTALLRTPRQKRFLECFRAANLVATVSEHKLLKNITEDMKARRARNTIPPTE